MKERAKRIASGVLATLESAAESAALLGALSLAGASASLYRVITTRAETDQDSEP
ncbi:MAG: hypothetical protein ACYTFI_13335 [Planctomycetota bacterium]|jgi:hypothetical protein